jgi:hypothetical protein
MQRLNSALHCVNTLYVPMYKHASQCHDTIFAADFNLTSFSLFCNIYLTWLQLNLFSCNIMIDVNACWCYLVYGPTVNLT